MENKPAILYVIILIEVLVYFTAEPHGYSTDSGLAPHFTYMLFHGNIFHLAGNLLCLWFVYDKRIMNPYGLFLIAYFCCTASSFLSEMATPTIGLSGFVFAVIGVLMASVRPTLFNISVVSLSLALGFVVPNSNPYVHFFSFAMAFFLTHIKNLITRYI